MDDKSGFPIFVNTLQSANISQNYIKNSLENVSNYIFVSLFFQEGRIHHNLQCRRPKLDWCLNSWNQINNQRSSPQWSYLFIWRQDRLANSTWDVGKLQLNSSLWVFNAPCRIRGVTLFEEKKCRFVPGVIGCGRIVQVKLKVVNIPLA